MFSSEMSKNVSKCTTTTFLAFIRPALVFIGRSSIYLATLILIILFNSILMTKWNRLKNPLQVSHRTCLVFILKTKTKKISFVKKRSKKYQFNLMKETKTTQQLNTGTNFNQPRYKKHHVLLKTCDCFSKLWQYFPRSPFS